MRWVLEQYGGTAVGKAEDRFERGASTKWERAHPRPPATGSSKLSGYWTPDGPSLLPCASSKVVPLSEEEEEGPGVCGFLMVRRATSQLTMQSCTAGPVIGNKFPAPKPLFDNRFLEPFL